MDGTVEFDAGVMDGSSGRVGALCAATWPANPVRVAREIAEVGGAPDGPLLLAAAGADRFAEEHGFPPMDASLLTGVRAAASPGGGAPPSAGGGAPPGAVGTVGAVAVGR